MKKTFGIVGGLFLAGALVWGAIQLSQPQDSASEPSIEDVVGQEKIPASLKGILPPETFDRQTDCPTECSRFSEKPEELLHCQQACGLLGSTEPGDCESKQGLQKDVCLKDQALTELNFDLCDQIADADLQETCRNRITEEIIDTQQGLRE